MPYKVQFVGLICFESRGKDKGRRALIPDGRFPEPGVQPHIASISVRTADLLGYKGWYDDQVAMDQYETEFLFPPSSITLPSACDAGDYEEIQLTSRLPSLKKMDKNFRIDDNANWIGCVDIRSGCIEAMRAPGLEEATDVPLISELSVPHRGRIEITVKARKGWPVRTIRLKAGSEIAIINQSRGLAPKNQRSDHFPIYGELSAAPVTLRAPELPASTRSKCPISQSEHPVFRQARPATRTVACINATS